MKIALETNRIYLRSFRSSDGMSMHEYLSLERVVRYEPYSEMSLIECTREAKRRSNDPSFYAVIQKETNKLIGSIYFHQQQPYKFRTYELGYVFNPAYWNMGYATEAAELILKYGFLELDLHRIIANCNQENERSVKLLERIGMRRESSSKKDVFFRYLGSGEPNWVNSYMYAILKEDYIQTNVDKSTT